MKGIWVRLLGLTSLLVCLVSGVRADLTIRLRQSAPGRAISETILYFKGARQRNDLLSIDRRERQTALGSVIFQCDRNLYLWLDEENHTFWSTPYEDAAWQNASLPAVQKNRAGGLVTETYTLTDTGERREMYGYTARHIKTTRHWEAAPACRQSSLRQETDGWYIDLLYGLGCSPDLSGTFPRGAPVAQTACGARYERRHYRFQRTQKGTARLGFPVRETVTTYDDRNRPTATEWAVTEFSDKPLNDALFEVSAQYHEIAAPGTQKSLIARLLSWLPWR